MLYIMNIMNKMSLSTFRRNGYEVLAAAPVCVTVRKKGFLYVRRYRSPGDAGRWLPWAIASRRTAVDWRNAFEEQSSQVVTLDGSPSLVVEQWNDDSEG